MQTTSIRAEEITRDWYLVDAENQTLGRMASKVAQILRGKNKTYFTPHMDMGDFVVIINAEKVQVTGNKETDKSYFRHSGYPGGITNVNLKIIRQQHPEKIITNAVKGDGNFYKVVADLTIKGITHPVTFQANVAINGLNFLARAKIKIDRTKWDIKYNSGSFFDGLGDYLILDEIEFDVFLLSEK